LAVTTSERSKRAPELPTVEESGLTPYDVGSWQGVIAPVGTPNEIVERLHAAIEKIQRSEKVVKQLNEGGMEPTPSTPDEFAEFISSEIDRWQTVASNVGLTPD